MGLGATDPILSKIGGGVPAPAEPPKFQPIDIGAAQQGALNFDIQGYDTSDADLAKRFPGLVATRNAQIEDSYKQLTGPLDPTVQNAYTKQGVEQALGSTGGGFGGASLGGTGSNAQNTVATSLANNVLAKQDYDRSNAQALRDANQERSYGFNGTDVTNLSIADTQNENQNNQNQYAYQLALQNAGAAKDAANAQATFGVVSSALSAL